ncbi:Phosphoribosylglycinamide formyltransferase [Planctomycetes bacterium Pan216]|uniref:Phosphoribosylglycinamide formyltransferase n=1 Tax=Kolteria novifilia TaxID=2527975 RepID=A0A518B9X4_9BACT|nr:Phosphoribosylglycinamide formyltransferase [Planctomycetes bacterium Pan216]
MAIRLAVLVSGRGTTLANLLDRINEGQLDAEVAVVISNRPNVLALNLAELANLPAHVVDKDADEELGAKVFQICREANVDLVVLAGFLRFVKIPDDFVGKVMNIHPSLIPAFCGHGYYGSRVHAGVLERGCKVSGCTVHFADNHEYDHGPIVLQRVVPVLEGDTPESLQQRVFEAECEAFPQAIQLFAEGRLSVEDGRVRVRRDPSGGS